MPGDLAKTIGTVGLLLASLLTFSACPSSKPSGEPSEAAPSASSAASPPASAAPSAAAPAIETWKGKYTSAVGSLYVYDGGEWAGVTWRGDEAGAGLGEGEMSLEVDHKTGAVRGTATGPLGDMVIQGAVDKDRVSASILRKDPRDRGFTGTLTAAPAGDKLTGSMKVSPADARVLREASFTLAREAR